jgi:polyisoprenoid-binding protein YceI
MRNHHNSHRLTTLARTSQLIILFVFGATVLLAQTAKGLLPYENRAHQMVIEGTSNLHDWQTKVFRLNLKAQFAVENNLVNTVGTVVLTADARSIKSDKGSIMDGKTHDALKTEKHPNITFRLKQIQSLEMANKVTEIKTTGDLSIAGVTRPVNMTVYTKLLPNNEIEVWGSYKLKMSVFGIAAPTAMMGSIKTGDEVIVRFDIIMKP